MTGRKYMTDGAMSLISRIYVAVWSTISVYQTLGIVDIKLVALQKLRTNTNPSERTSTLFGFGTNWCAKGKQMTTLDLKKGCHLL